MGEVRDAVYGKYPFRINFAKFSQQAWAYPGLTLCAPDSLKSDSILT